jgi:3-phosphoshikimate 1-carboxyvinyltransferase
MIYELTYSGNEFDAQLQLAGSKSESNRVLIIRFLSGQSFAIDNLSNADDTSVLDEILNNIHTQQVFNVGHAGTAMRFLTALFAITPGERILQGSERMHQRPIALLVDALRSLGAEIEYLQQDGYPPLRIVGKPLDGGDIDIRGDVSSQYLSAMAMIAPYLSNGLTLHVTSEFSSKPYLLMTLNMMRHFGAMVDDLGDTIRIHPSVYSSRDYVVESDWSSASYWFEALAFTKHSSLKLLGLKHDNSMQPDATVQQIYEWFGVETTPVEGGIQLTKKEQLPPEHATIDFTDFPDIAQTVSCSFLGFQSKAKFTGLHTLRIKETDRIAALKNELEKLGAQVSVTESTLSIDGFTIPQDDVAIATHNDHRMAMAFSALVFVLGTIRIKDPMVVSKSYPNFWNDLQQLGVQISQI